MLPESMSDHACKGPVASRLRRKLHVARTGASDLPFHLNMKGVMSLTHRLQWRENGFNKVAMATARYRISDLPSVDWLVNGIIASLSSVTILSLT